MHFGIVHYFSFIGAVLLFQLMPGPGTLTILRSTATGGVAAGMRAVLGTLAGDMIYMLGAALGLASLLTARPALFSVLQWAGIAYLCWIGLQLLRKPVSKAQGHPPETASHWSHFRTALLVCLTNPKALMFFMAFFPLFLLPDAGWQTLALLILHVTALSALYQTLLVLAGNACARQLVRFPWIQRAGRPTAGLALILFGLRLAINRR